MRLSDLNFVIIVYVSVRWIILDLQKKWVELFPTIVSKSRLLEVLSPGVLGNHSGSLQLVNFVQIAFRDCSLCEMRILSVLIPKGVFQFSCQMYEELQVLSPLVPTRQLYLLRFCQQIEQGLWAIVNVSYDLPQEISQLSSLQARCHKLPSGCLIQDIPNGYSKVNHLFV